MILDELRSCNDGGRVAAFAQTTAGHLLAEQKATGRPRKTATYSRFQVMQARKLAVEAGIYVEMREPRVGAFDRATGP